MITIWHGMTIQGLYCYLDMGKNTVTYHKCSHVPNLLNENIRLLNFSLYIYINVSMIELDRHFRNNKVAQIGQLNLCFLSVSVLHYIHHQASV